MCHVVHIVGIMKLLIIIFYHLFTRLPYQKCELY